MNKKIISRDVQIVVRLMDDTDPTVFDGFKSLDEALSLANLHKSYGDDVYWLDECITYDDGSVIRDRHYV